MPEFMYLKWKVRKLYIVCTNKKLSIESFYNFIECIILKYYNIIIIGSIWLPKIWH